MDCTFGSGGGDGGGTICALFTVGAGGAVNQSGAISAELSKLLAVHLLNDSVNVKSVLHSISSRR